MAIPNRVRECFDAFSINLAEEQGASYLEDELGRFKIWAGNIAAHRPTHNRRSLEYRLRDSSGLREIVLSLLQDLVVAIHDLRKQPLSGNPLMSQETPSDELAARSTRVGTELAPNDAQSENADIFELSDEESIDEDTPIRQALSEVHDVITCLLRFSMTLRRPSRDDQRRDDPAGVAEAFVIHDTEHVRAKFPEAPDYLIRRLGKTLSKHRQYFRYRREHHQKLHEGVGEGDVRAWELPSTVATSLPNDTSNVQNPFGLGTESETESAYTATSYAGTSTGNVSLRVPPWPISARSESPFECPICFGIIVADSENSWRQHVFEDVPPYVCVSENCHSAVKSFSRRREWARHHDTMHDRTWVCPHACAKLMSSPAELRSHLAAEHAHAVLPHILQKATIASEQSAKASTSLSCPLCTRPCNSSKSWIKHVGHHLEQVALFSLPMELFSTDTPNDSDEERIDDDGHSSALTSGSEHTGDNDHVSQDLVPDVEEMQASELLMSDASNQMTDSPPQRHYIESVAWEPLSEDYIPDDIRPSATTSASKIVEDDLTPEEEIERLRDLIEAQDDESIAHEVALMEAEEAHPWQILKAGQEQEQGALEAGEKSAANLDVETRAANNQPLPDIHQAPVLFMDAVGRKFTFPWNFCKSWKGMETLIKQAFSHVDLIGAHIQEGRYDLMGPDGEIILPQVWETMVKPGMEVSMHMWPLPEDARTPNNYGPQEATMPDDYLLTKATTLRGSMSELQDEPPDGDAPSSVKGLKKKKELSAFAAWMAGQSPKPSKPRRPKTQDSTLR